jgi:hypothetical protein
MADAELLIDGTLLMKPGGGLGLDTFVANLNWDDFSARTGLCSSWPGGFKLRLVKFTPDPEREACRNSSAIPRYASRATASSSE